MELVAVLAKVADHLFAQLGIVVDDQDVAGGKDIGLGVHGLSFLIIVAQAQPQRHNPDENAAAKPTRRASARAKAAGAHFSGPGRPGFRW